MSRMILMIRLKVTIKVKVTIVMILFKSPGGTSLLIEFH